METHRFVFKAFGHEQITATHPTTIEITRREHLTSNGDCVVAVGATHSLRDLPVEIRRALTGRSGRCELAVSVNHETFTVRGRGDPGLKLTHAEEMVVRRSGFISERTLMVLADKAAQDVPRRMVVAMRHPDQEIKIELVVWTEETREG